MLLTIFFAIIPILLSGTGVYIWKREAIWLLSNFAEASVKDKKGLARWAGIFLCLFAVLMLLFGFSITRFAGTPYELLPVLLLIVCICPLVITYMMGAQRFLHKNLKKHNNNG
jgi:nucleoside recognition membrane protein YjiH